MVVMLMIVSFKLRMKAPRQYAEKLSSKFIQVGARPIWMPGVKITSLCDQDHLDEVKLQSSGTGDTIRHGAIHIIVSMQIY